MNCEAYNPDTSFSSFEVVEFPITFVGLSSSLEINFEVDLNKSAYLKTTHKGQWMKFNDAKKVSAHHSVFTIEQTNAFSIRIKFKPTKDSISWAKSHQIFDNTFFFDLRLIKLDEIQCCYNESHAEIGRYYVIAQCEYCNISHFPKIIDFGDVIIKNKVSRCINITNNSSRIPAIIKFKKCACFIIEPEKVTVNASSTKSVCVSLTPRSFDIAKVIHAKIRSSHNVSDYLKEFFIPYSIPIHRNIFLDKLPKQLTVESLHRLHEPNPEYTYIDKEINTHKKKQQMALDILKSAKIHSNQRIIKKQLSTSIYPKESCKIFLSHEQTMSADCVYKEDDDLKISMYDLFQISILPLPVDFGQVSVNSFAEKEIIIKNNSQFDINIMFLNNNSLLYTENKSESYKQKIIALGDAKIKIYYYGTIEGEYEGIFQFTVDQKYTRTHSYVAHVSYPKLMVRDRELRFGMVTSEKFIMSVQVRIENNFNVNIDFQWHGLDIDVPFKIIPISGSVPKRSCRICNIIYISKPINTKTFEIELISKRGTSTQVIPFELNILTKKLSVAFTHPLVSFKDIPLNIATSLEVKLENPSKEFFYFSVEELLIPGIFIKPMTGTIRPKTVVNFEITVKISCAVEFKFDICFKINNKENISLTVTGNVLEPKVVIHPKNIIMPRIPSNMKTYIPVKLQNLGILKSIVKIVQHKSDKSTCNFVPIDIFTEIDNEKQKVTEISLDKGQSKTVYLQIYGPSLIEYDLYGPFQINGILGPPNSDHSSLALQYYTGEFEKLYENDTRARSTNKEISYLHMTGVVTKEWIRFSIAKFHFNYEVGGANSKEFTITNVSKNILNIHISTLKLSPNFTLKCSEDTLKELTALEFELEPGQEAYFFVKFHPRRHGRFTSTAVLYLDKNFAVPFNNLTFTGNRQRVPLLTANAKIVIFPPCVITEKLHQDVVLKMEGTATIDSFFSSHPQKTIEVKFLNAEIIREQDKIYTILNVKISITRAVTQEKNLLLRFHHESGAMCEIAISVCFTNCPLTTHVSNLVKPYSNPYPYYPSTDQVELYEYMETCINFLEKWLFNQGFRNEFYPSIPDSLYALSTISHTKHKGMNISFLNFIRRIAGPMVKRFCKVPTKTLVDESILVQDIHDAYVELIRLLRSRGSYVWVINPKFLLSHHQFVVYTNNVAPKCNIDISMTKELVSDAEKYRRLSKQSWMDFILQTYRVFVLNSCFFDCVCVSGQERDIIRILIEWYNKQTAAKHQQLRGNSRSIKVIRNITTDLSDGIAIISALLYNCPFLQEHFSIFCELEEDNTESIIIHNACLIVAALKQLRISFPLSSHELLKPNFIQMLFLSVHLYVVLPMFKPREVIKFNPSLLKTSQRLVSICPETQESIIFDYIMFNNEKNCFVVEKTAASESGNKTYLSIKYTANFVANQKSILLVFGYNKTRIFDTYIVFVLEGGICSLEPLKKCKVSGLVYRPTKVEIVVPSPFKTAAIFEVFIVDDEPKIPVNFEKKKRPCFFARRLILFDQEVRIKASQAQNEKEGGIGQRMPLKLVCLTSMSKDYFIWFRSNIGEFYLKVLTIPRLDWPLESLTAKLNVWPPIPCSCEKECECYRTSIVFIPHRNDLMVKAIRLTLQEFASDVMLKIFDRLIEKPTGRLVLAMMLAEGGLSISALANLLRNDSVYLIKSRNLQPKMKRVNLQPYSDAVLSLPVTIPAQDEAERYNIVLASEDGMDVRTYRIHFIASQK